MLNSAEHENFSANKYENANKFSCSARFSKKELAIDSNLRIISTKSFMLSSVQHEKSFITSGPGYTEYLIVILKTHQNTFLWGKGYIFRRLCQNFTALLKKGSIPNGKNLLP